MRGGLEGQEGGLGVRNEGSKVRIGGSDVGLWGHHDMFSNAHEEVEIGG